MAHKDRENKLRNSKRFRALGLMSGTSMDGIDAAILDTDGKERVVRGSGATYAYDAAFRARIAAALEEAKAVRRRDERPGSLAALEREITLRHADAVRQFLAASGLVASDVDVIGFHGQTVLHRPQEKLTVQLGDGQLLAYETGIPVIHDMRANDVALGGQGAPLVPAYHRALAHALPKALADRWPVAFVNIGGIANLTFVPLDGGLVALDTGPGNALIDQWVAHKAGIPFDADGAIGEAGKVIESLAATFLNKPFFARPLPKSLDRNDFLPPGKDAASLADGARTLAHVTARAITASLRHLPGVPQLVIACGGGRKNRAIMAELASALAEIPGNPKLLAAEEAALDGDAMEAEAWAYLAVRSLRGLAITFPGATGVPAAATGGVLSIPK